MLLSPTKPLQGLLLGVLLGDLEMAYYTAVRYKFNTAVHNLKSCSLANLAPYVYRQTRSPRTYLHITTMQQLAKSLVGTIFIITVDCFQPGYQYYILLSVP